MRKISKKRLAKLGGKVPFSTISSKPKKHKSWKRKPSEFKRIYGSKERVEWMKRQPCIACAIMIQRYSEAVCAGIIEPGGLSFNSQDIQNAHTVNGGRGRKGDYTTIIPLCAYHHERYDEYCYPFTGHLRQVMKDAAIDIERRWQSESQPGATR